MPLSGLERMLIRTKLVRPPVRAGLVARPRLRERLDAVLRHRLTLVSAPPGSGKSTLVTQWLDGRQEACAWVALDEFDRAPERFTAYLVAAIEGATPHRLPETKALLAGPTPPPIAVVAEVLAAELARTAPALTIVLEDFHAAGSSHVPQIVERLVPAAPASLHLVVITRMDPPWPIAHWRAQGWLLEVRARDLRFSLDEVREFFSALQGQALSEDAIGLIHHRTEGWVTGLHLVELSLREATDREARVRAFSGTDRMVADYLMAEVVAIQPPETREFLAATALLPRFCGPLGDWLLGERPGAPPAREILARLERDNLFLVPLDVDRHWCRYHHLFQELLLYHLKELASPKVRAATRRRAAEWFAQEGLVDEALHLWIAANDLDAAAGLVGQHFRRAIEEDLSRRALTRWLAAFPEGAEHGRLQLLIAHAHLKTMTWDLPGLASLLDEAETLLPGWQGQPDGEDTGRLRLDLDALRAFLMYWRGDAKGAARLASRALDGLPPRSRGYTRTLACYYKAGGLVLDGRRAEGLRVLEDAIAEAGGHDPSRVGPYVFALGALHLHADDLASAELMARRAMAVHETAPMSDYWLGHVLYLRAAIAYERNLLDEAATIFRLIVTMRHRTSARIYQDAVIGLCLIARARGNGDEAKRQAADARAFALEVGDPTSLCVADSLDIRLGLGSDGPPPALSAPAIQDASFFWLEIPSLTYAEFLVDRASVDGREEALPFIDQALARVGALHNTRQGLPLELVRALALAEGGDRPAALEALAPALSHAERLGLVRSVLDRGPRMIALLQDLAKQRGRRGYLDCLLSAGEHGAPPPVAVRPVIHGSAEPPGVGPAAPAEELTNREMDVLELLAKRLSNKEIADRLGVSPHTVKRHTVGIYQKLQAQGRRQAVSRAVSAGLIKSDS